MFDHVKFGVSNYAASKAFFIAALKPLGLTVGHEAAPMAGIELCLRGDALICLYQATGRPSHLHLAFTAESRRQVDDFYQAALAAGGTR